jgi:pimeloyl-ACP methyl ester carboxylesterase
MSEPLEPFRIAVPQAILDDLGQRLERTRWPDASPHPGWRQGTELAYLQSLVETWRATYDWRRTEALLNGFPQFTAEVDGLRLHLLYARSPHAAARPLLLLHGWPGSVYEFHKLIPRLTEPERYGGRAEEALHVVAPSLPGYGFSSAPRRPGASPRQIARWMHALMTDGLGHARYFVQGGDWGSVIGSWLAVDQPQAVTALHVNMLGLPPARGSGAATAPLPPEEQAYLERAKRLRGDEFGYQAIQGSRPQSLGYGLMDSPVGLAAWLVEKYRAWTDCGGDLEQALPREDVLALITLYWVTGSITSSMRLYYEFRAAKDVLAPGQRVTVPVGFADFPREILRAPRSLVERAYAIAHWTEMPRGGHFAALEQPDLLAGDVRTFFAGH